MKDKKRLSVRIPTDLYAELERQAEMRALSPSTLARTVIVMWIRDNKTRSSTESGGDGRPPAGGIGRTLGSIVRQ